MKKLVLAGLVVALGLGPALVTAQTTDGKKDAPTAPSSRPGTPPGGSMPSTPGMPPAPPSASPSTEPSGSKGQQFTNRADCEKAGGKWQAAQNKCDLGG